MPYQDAQTIMDSLIPATIGGALGLFALLGIRELFKETTVALKKKANA